MIGTCFSVFLLLGVQLHPPVAVTALLHLVLPPASHTHLLIFYCASDAWSRLEDAKKKKKHSSLTVVALLLGRYSYCGMVRGFKRRTRA